MYGVNNNPMVQKRYEACFQVLQYYRKGEGAQDQKEMKEYTSLINMNRNSFRQS